MRINTFYYIKNVITDIHVASVTPTSRFGVEKVMEKVPFPSSQVILEYGPGTGNFTTTLLKNMPENSKLIAIEKNPDFCHLLNKTIDDSFVEGIFNVNGNNKVKSLLAENDVDFNDELIIRREISLKGSNRCFINDTPVNLNLVKDIGNLLVDLHGQHEHQSLLRTETHIDYLDEFGDYQDLLHQYKNAYSELLAKEIELKDLREKESSIKEKKDFHSFQIKEIDAISPQEDEEEKLIEELKILENSEKLAELSSEVYHLLYDSDN